MTPEVWDYIFLDKSYPKQCNIKQIYLDAMKHEFEYWYPVDLRCSGKDLIQNHLTFCIYNHCAMWANRPDLWPKSIRANGHLLLNSAKVIYFYYVFICILIVCTTFQKRRHQVATSFRPLMHMSHYTTVWRANCHPCLSIAVRRTVVFSFETEYNVIFYVIYLCC